MRTELVRSVKVIILAWPVIGSTAIMAFLVVFRRPLRRILEQFNCTDVERIKIGPIEIVKQGRPKHTRNLRRKKNPSTRLRQMNQSKRR